MIVVVALDSRFEHIGHPGLVVVAVPVGWSSICCPTVIWIVEFSQNVLDLFPHFMFFFFIFVAVVRCESIGIFCIFGICVHSALLSKFLER